MTEHLPPRNDLAPSPDAGGDTLVLRAVRRLGRPAPATDKAGPASTVTRLRPAPAPRTDAGARRSAAIDHARLAALGFIDPIGQPSRLAEELRVVKRPLLTHAFAPGAPPNGRIIVVTSPLPGEGKTFLAVNLALSLSLERDANVLLIDGDLTLAEASERLGIDRTPGLSDLLADSPVDPGDALVRTDVARLAFVPPGTPTAGMPELLGSRRMAAIVETVLAADPRRLIVIDSPAAALQQRRTGARLPRRVRRLLLGARRLGVPRPGPLCAVADLAQAVPPPPQPHLAAEPGRHPRRHLGAGPQPTIGRWLGQRGPQRRLVLGAQERPGAGISRAAGRPDRPALPRCSGARPRPPSAGRSR